MRIESAEETDLDEIGKLIKGEFPYVERSIDSLREKIRQGIIVIFKAVDGGKILGFAEAEFLGEGIARINGLTVKHGQRGSGVGKKLLDKALNFLKGNDVARVLLLVKESNKKAKKMYEGMGFQFIGLYHRKLDGAVVEEMELDLVKGTPDYVA